jgi:hypothetical protein
MRFITLALACAAMDGAHAGSPHRTLGLMDVALKLGHLNTTSLANKDDPFWTSVGQMLDHGLASRSELVCALSHSKSQLQEDLRLLSAILLAGGTSAHGRTFVELGKIARTAAQRHCTRRHSASHSVRSSSHTVALHPLLAAMQARSTGCF